MNVDETSPAAVLQEIRAILERVRGESELTDTFEITMDTTFQEDLELESIDLVQLGAHLDARYGGRVNFAEFIADLELDEIISLTVGRLVDFVVARLRERRPASLEVCVLFDKRERRLVDVPVRYTGFTIPNAFVVGYGLDFRELYRNLPFVCILKQEVYARDAMADLAAINSHPPTVTPSSLSDG